MLSFLNLIWTDPFPLFSAAEEKQGLLHTVSCDGDCSRPYPFTFLTGAFPLHFFLHCHDVPLPKVRFSHKCVSVPLPQNLNLSMDLTKNTIKSVSVDWKEEEFR